MPTQRLLPKTESAYPSIRRHRVVMSKWCGSSSEPEQRPTPKKTSFNKEIPSPFWLAAQNGNVAIGKLLIERGANQAFAIGSSKRQPIHQATQNGYVDFVGLLIEQRVNVDAREQNGWTPLMLAAQGGYVEIINQLLEASASVNA